MNFKCVFTLIFIRYLHLIKLFFFYHNYSSYLLKSVISLVKSGSESGLTLCLRASTIRSRPPLTFSSLFEARKTSPMAETVT